MKKQIFVGGTLKDAAARVINVARRADQGETIAPEDNLTFLAWSALAAVMTDKRHELLRHLHRRPAPSIRALARDLGRDFKRVHEDVTALERAGLIERDGTGLHADYARIQATILLDATAA
jgi:predicted transcriptional regulator